jgi:chitinase
LEYSVSDGEFTSMSQLTATVTEGTPPATPGVPSLGWIAAEAELINGSVDLPFSWNMWYGVRGNEWRLIQNGEVIFSQSLNGTGNGAQSASTVHTVTQAGEYDFSVQLCNVSGSQEACSSSASTPVRIFDASGLPTSPGDYPHALRQQNEAYNNTSGKMVAAYFVEWGVYGRNFHVADIPDDNLTHLFYGFVPICGANESLRLAQPGPYSVLVSQCQGKQDFEVVVHDKFAALEKSYPGDQDGKGIAGVFGQLQRMKLANPNIKILPSVGGWTLSDPLYEIGTNPTARATFINSMMDYLRTYTFFDGVDIDWEFPGGGGANETLGSPQDADGFADLMIELRAALDSLSTETGRTYELTAAVSGGVEKLSKINWERSHQVMDYINVMSYDYAGAWNNELGHQANLYESDLYATTNIGFNAHASVQHLLGRTVPPAKITLGIAMYGRGWKGVTGATPSNPFTGMGNGPIEGSWDDGIEDYKTLEANFMNGTSTGANGYELRWDPVARAEYLWNSLTGTLISLDTARTTIEKGEYVNANNLGGVFAWEIDADNGHILNAMHQGLGHPKKQ